MMHLAKLIGDLEMTAPALWAWLASACLPAATTLVTSIWQGAVIVCGLEIALRLMPRISAAHRFAVWAAGFVVALGLPWLPLLHFGASAAESAGSGATGSSAAPLLQLDARWVLAIAALWAGALAVRGASLALHSVRLRRLWKAAQPVAMSEALAAALGTVRGGRATICTTEMLDRPSVIGFLAPRILIPAWLMARLTPGELEQIVLHEAEHLRRRDDWTNLVQKLVLVAFPLNPALVWMERRLCREREMACDEGVVRITNAPRAYAACLASLAERGLERRAEALSLGAWHGRPELVHRVHGILWRKSRLSKGAAVAMLGTVGCALIAGSVEMARCPQLVAFVPQQKSMAMTPERQREMAAILARENAEAKVSLPSGFRAVPAREVMPEMSRTSLGKPARHDARKNSGAVNLGATESARQIAKADAAGDRVNPGPEQQWVVLAAWEEVQTVSRISSGTTSDYEANAVTDDGAAQTQQSNGMTAGQGTAPGQAASKTPQQNQTSSQYTVTRLILRVVPANSNSTQPATIAVRGGWFVIQL
jgi:beta-lactamase regulating signal transducer with metallopeptidase domain